MPCRRDPVAWPIHIRARRACAFGAPPPFETGFRPSSGRAVILSRPNGTAIGHGGGAAARGRRPFGVERATVADLEERIRQIEPEAYRVLSISTLKTVQHIRNG